MNNPNQSPSRFRIPELDGLRGIAILLVLIHHYLAGHLGPEAGWIADWVTQVFALSWSGVDLFFVLSGFLIGGILLEERESPNYFSSFFIRRASRILPLYFAWLILYWIILWSHKLDIGSDQWLETFAPIYPHWAYAAFAQNFFVAGREVFGPFWLGATWSLAVEVQFYLLVPFLVRFISERKLPWVLGAIMVAVPLLRVMMYMCHPTVFVYTVLPCRVDTFVLGIFCAWLIRNAKFRQRLVAKQTDLQWLLLLLIFGLALLSTKPFGSRTSFEMVLFGYTLLPMFYGCLLLIVLTADNGLIVGVVRNSLLQKLGVIAYGVFLMHLGIAGVAHAGLLYGNGIMHSPGDAWVTLLALAVTLALASLSWRYFEKPIMNWSHRFIPQKTISPNEPS